MQAYDCGYGVIYSIAPSPRDNKTIWIGTDDGLIQHTDDGGSSWRNVTPNGLPIWSKVASLDLSAMQAGTAYAAVNRHRLGDFSPHVWRTHDTGAHWTDVGGGLPAGSFVSVVRADPQREGLLYAGTNHGAFVSFDDGDHWQSLQRNLPTAWVRDLLVHGDDLVAATQGRAIWILDDVTPLRQASAAEWAPRRTCTGPRQRCACAPNENRDTPLPPETPLGKNPPAGAIIDYHLAQAANGPVTLKILDSDGKTVREFSSADQSVQRDAERYFPKGWLRPGQPLSAAAGAHRFVWDLRYARPDAIEYGYSIAATWDTDTPLTPEGALVLPGTYQLVLTVGGTDYRAPLQVLMDPREHVVRADLVANLELSRQVADTLQHVWQTWTQLQAVRRQLDALGQRSSGNAPWRQTVQALQAKTRPLVSGSGERSVNLHAINDALTAIATDLESADGAPTDGQRQALAEYRRNIDKAMHLWHAIEQTDLPALDSQLQRAGMGAIKVPDADQITRQASEGPEDEP